MQCNKRSQWQRGEVDNPVYTEVQRKQLVVIMVDDTEANKKKHLPYLNGKESKRVAFLKWWH